MNSTNQYIRLAAMTVLSFISMYIFMYAMVDRFANVYSSFNQFYMAGLMTAPMVIIELLVMWGMYENKTFNIAIVAISAIALIGFFALIRGQVAIGDRQFLRSMIPHHSGAILMCERANIEDPGLKELCRNIIVGQQQEIDDMTARLQAHDKSKP
jgi:hypothetical protein